MDLVQPPGAAGDQAWRAKHEAILTAAHDLFINQGYDATTMKALAARAGCSVGYLYKHFPGKQEILDALSADYLNLYLGIRERSRGNGAAPAADLLVHELDELCHALLDHRGIIPLYSERETAMAPEIRDMVKRTRQEDVELLAAARAKGELPDIDPQMVAAAYNGAVWGLMRASAHADPQTFLSIPGTIDELIFAPLRRRAQEEADDLDATSSG